jgi:hypothetical protein
MVTIQDIADKAGFREGIVFYVCGKNLNKGAKLPVEIIIRNSTATLKQP